MAVFFIPRAKNPPAKVKDRGIINLALEGAAAYNAKSGEMLLLPAACREKNRLSEELFSALSAHGFQQADCGESADAVFSLAERYVREYGEQALFWIQERGRDLELCGWGASREEVARKTENALAEIVNVAAKRARIVMVPVTGVRAGGGKIFKGVAPTEKGSVSSLQGFECEACGGLFLPDSAHLKQGAPVNAESAAAELKEVHTPDAHTIPLLCEYLGIPAKTTLKAMLYTLELGGGGKELLFAMIRGDMDVSIPKLTVWVEDNYPGAVLRRAEEAEIIEAFGEVAGFCGPVGVPASVRMVADFSLERGKNFVVGGNRPGYHRTGCCWGRDFSPPLADLVLYTESLPCPLCCGRRG